MSERPWAVIMAGGSGTRFWPASRSRRPKQLLPLGADPSESLLAATVRRIRPLVPGERVIVVTGAALAEATRAALPEVPPENVLCEPVGRNTAPCIAWAAAHVLRKDPSAVVCVLPSDHTIADEETFRGVLSRALATAAAGTVTTVGIKPTRPETGYGYVETGAPSETGGGALSVVRFVEKPDLERAKQYVDGGRHLWNAGMFFFRADAMRALVSEHLPELAAGVARIDAAAGGPDAARVLAEVFPTLPSVSIDHGVMEKAKKLAVVPGDFGWNDVGSWQSAWELADKDQRGNAARGDAVFVEASGNLVHDLTTGAKKKLFAVVGVDDLVIVETDDAVLVIRRDRAQDVRAAVDALKAKGRADVL